MEKNIQLLRDFALLNHDFTYLIMNMNQIADMLPREQKKQFYHFMLQFLVDSNVQLNEIVEGKRGLPLIEPTQLSNIGISELLSLLGMKDPSLQHLISSLLESMKVDLQNGNSK